MADTSLKQRFLDIAHSDIQRAGLVDFMRWLETTDFYSAPASTKFHGNYAGGLLQHSLNVYDALKNLLRLYPLEGISDETVAIASLFHDVCKANYYTVGTKNVKDEATGVWHKEPFYKTDDQFPVGHGEKSVILLMRYMELTDQEIYAIRWHMSGFDSAVKGGDFGCSKAYEVCPFAVLLHLADMTATYLMEERCV